MENRENTPGTGIGKLTALLSAAAALIGATVTLLQITQKPVAQTADTGSQTESSNVRVSPPTPQGHGKEVFPEGKQFPSSKNTDTPPLTRKQDSASAHGAANNLSGKFPTGIWTARERAGEETGTFRLDADTSATLQYGSFTLRGHWLYFPTLDGHNLLTINIQDPSQQILMLKVLEVTADSFTANDGQGTTINFQRKRVE